MKFSRTKRCQSAHIYSVAEIPLFIILEKNDLLIVNNDEGPVILVTHRGVKEYTGRVPENKREAKIMEVELIDLTQSDCFGEEKTLLFIQTITVKYKVDYTKHGTPLFIRVHKTVPFNYRHIYKSASS